MIFQYMTYIRGWNIIIGKYPDIQDIIYKELSAVYGKDNFSLSRVIECPQFRAFINESLRIASATPDGVARTCLSNDLRCIKYIDNIDNIDNSTGDKTVIKYKYICDDVKSSVCKEIELKRDNNIIDIEYD